MNLLDWDLLKLEVFQAIENFYQSGQPILLENTKKSNDTDVNEEDDEVVVAIKELLESRIRPMVQEDGGDIIFHNFNNGIVYLKLQGSCTSCPSSSDTLKGGVENMLMHYIPEVISVEQIKDEGDLASEEAFNKLENKLKEENKEQ